MSCWLKANHKSASLETLNKQFEQAIQDAWQRQSDEEATLVSLNGRSEFLIVTWTEEKKAEQLVDRINKAHTFQQPIWVAPAFQVKGFCRTCHGSISDRRIPTIIKLRVRLLSYLGLSLEQNKTHFVTLKVKKNDLFRPCIDKEIDDQSCNLPNDEEIQEFLFKHSLGLNPKEPRFPWTALGYTFDWSTDSNGQHIEVGASEYVINPESIVEVVSVEKTSEFCNNQYIR